MRALFVLFFALPSIGFAGDVLKEAKQRFQLAREHHERGEYREAIDLYLEIYEMRPAAQILFNLGQCYRNIQELDEAIDYFERYVDEIGDPIERDRVEALIVDLEAEAADREAEAAMIATATVAEAALPPIVIPPPPPPPVDRIVEPVIVEEVQSSIVTEWWFWTIIGVAAVAAAGGAAAAVVTRDTTPEGSIATIDVR